MRYHGLHKKQCIKINMRFCGQVYALGNYFSHCGTRKNMRGSVNWVLFGTVVKLILPLQVWGMPKELVANLFIVTESN